MSKPTNATIKSVETVLQQLIEQYQTFLSPEVFGHEAVLLVHSDAKHYSKLCSLFEGACFMTDLAAHFPPMLPKTDCKDFLLEFSVIIPFQFPESELEQLYKIIAPTSPGLLYPQFVILLYELAYKVNTKARDKMTRIDLFKLQVVCLCICVFTSCI